MKCYRYLGRYYGLRTLLDGRFKLSAPCEFNDPFDCAGAIVGTISDRYFENFVKPTVDKDGFLEDLQEEENFGLCERGTMRQHVEQFKEFYKRALIQRYLNKRSDFNKVVRILCLSNAGNGSDRHRSDDALLWSHYAEAGRGLRIGLDIDDAELPSPVVVRYTNQMPSMNLKELKVCIDSEPYDGHPQVEFLDRCLRTKSKPWFYEREVRLAFPVMDKRIESQSGKCFVKLKPRLFWRIDFGHKTFRDDAEFLSVVEKLRVRGYGHVEFRLAALDQRRYGYRYRTVDEVGKAEMKRLEKEARRARWKQMRMRGTYGIQGTD